jgi:O-acetyl-ADP-ribose deacetylase (regulator of RNase III)
VNCVGVMGKGIALTFKKQFPAMFEDYRARCEKGNVRPGAPYIWENDEVQILNFPTKRHWRQNSLLEDIESGLKYLRDNYADMGITSLALPPLGCGNGGLNWSEVKNLINKYLGSLEDIDIYVYEAYEAKQKPLGDSKSSFHSTNRDEGLVAQQSLI